MTAPAGAIVKLYVDTRLTIETGDIIETQTGRRYMVQTARLQARGRHAGTRQHLVVVVLAADEEVDFDVRVIPIRWYRR